MHWKCTYITVIIFVLGSITSRCSRKEPALLLRTHGSLLGEERTWYYHCPYNLSSNRSIMTSCLLLQGCKHFNYVEPFNHLQERFSSRTLRDLHDEPKHRLPRRPGARFSKSRKGFAPGKSSQNL